MMGIPFLEIEACGSHYEIGRQIGEAARDLIVASIAYYEEHHEAMGGISFAEAESESLAYLEPARRWVPHVVEELDGLAAGSGVPLSKLLVPNCGEELAFSNEGALRSDGSSAGEHGHCTSFAIAANGRVVAGHNEDWWSDDMDKNVLLRLEMSDGTRIVAMTAASLLAATGVNSHGIATGANSVFCTDGRVGVPNNFLRRWMLEASTLEEARQRACLPARARGSNHLLVHAGGRIWDVETSATADVTFESSSVFVHTNHYLHDAMLPHQMALELSSSRARYARACSLLDTGLRRGEDPCDLSFRVLADHENGELSICHHADETVPVGERESTTASMVWDVVAPSVDVCAGPPCENHRTHVDLA